MEAPPPRKPYPADVTNEERALVASDLMLMDEDAVQRRHDLGGLQRPALDRARRSALAPGADQLPTLARDDERLLEPVGDLQFLALARLMFHRLLTVDTRSSKHVLVDRQR